VVGHYFPFGKVHRDLLVDVSEAVAAHVIEGCEQLALRRDLRPGGQGEIIGSLQRNRAGQFREIGWSIIVTARRRPIEVDEVGIVLLPAKTSRRRVPEWLHSHKPVRLLLNIGEKLPRRLEDGQSLRAFAELDSTIDRLYGIEGVSYSYVQASGTVYLASDSKLRRRLRRRDVS
jgi:hypothetical protein